MNVLIENYRGFDILFSPENERFTYDIDLGHWSEKQSFAACKKSIDDYIKNNQSFEPFLVRQKYIGDVIKIVGIRKDNKLVYESGKDKVQLSDYYEKDYIEYDEIDDSIYSQCAALELEISEIEKKIRELKNIHNRKTLTELKAKYKN
jgi:hypothetical protein